MFLGNYYPIVDNLEGSFGEWLESVPFGELAEIPLKFCYRIRAVEPDYNIYNTYTGYDILPWIKDLFKEEDNKYTSVEYYLEWGPLGKPCIIKVNLKPKFDTPVIANGKNLDKVQMVQVESSAAAA